jgi:histidinol phosphatase-like enzyme
MTQNPTIWELDDLDALKLGDIDTLTPGRLLKLLPDKGANDLSKRFPHLLGAKHLAWAHGFDAEEAWKEPVEERGLAYLVDRFKHMASVGDDLVVGFLDREGSTVQKTVYKTLPDGTRKEVKLAYPLFDYVHRFFEGASDAFHPRETYEMKVFMTGQSGVGQGKFSEPVMAENLAQVLLRCEMLGFRFDNVAYCPHHPEKGETEADRYVCGARKGRGAGMIIEQLAFWKMIGINVDPHRVYVYGDKPDDAFVADDFNQLWVAKHGGDPPVHAFAAGTGYGGTGTNDPVVRAMGGRTLLRPAVGVAHVTQLPGALKRAGLYIST